MLRVSKSIPWFGTDERVSRRTVRMTSVRPTLRGRGAHTEPEKDELEKTETEQEGLRSGETEDGAPGLSPAMRGDIALGAQDKIMPTNQEHQLSIIHQHPCCYFLTII